VSVIATDVAIVGGGLAGTAAALTLRHHAQCDCTILEASGYQKSRVGETVSATVAPLLDYLRVLGFEGLRMLGSEASWGSSALTARESLLSVGGTSWSLDRRSLDARQSRAACQAGARVLKRSALKSVTRGANGWSLEFNYGGTSHRLVARQLIDATGRRAILSRKLGARREVFDRLLGLTAFTASSADSAPPTLLLEATPEGWWYSAPLPNRRTVLSFLTDADLARRDDETLRAAFRRRLARSLYIRERCGIRTLSAIRAQSAQSQWLKPCIGPDWVAAGDAAVSFDPLSSLGIGHALASGIQAARIAHQRLNGRETLAQAYERDLKDLFFDYWARRGLLYGSERRWPEQPFWSRRFASADATASTQNMRLEVNG
jgi:flavin-dependent dehydrogenase